MIIPVTTQNNIDTESPTEFPLCSDGPNISYTLLFILLFLIFYGLMLWDRHLGLKLRDYREESQKLLYSTKYGSADNTASRLVYPKSPITNSSPADASCLAPPPIPPFIFRVDAPPPSKST